MAPEVVEFGAEQLSCEADAYGLGMALYELCTHGKGPYNDVRHAPASPLAAASRLTHANACCSAFVCTLSPAGYDL